jgi:drug/metabolite transporter (DMT)-like permease
VSASTLFWVLLAQTIGGSTPIVTKLALEGLTPWQLAAGRQLLGSLILYSVARASGALGSGHDEAFDRRDWLLLLSGGRVRAAHGPGLHG